VYELSSFFYDNDAYFLHALWIDTPDLLLLVLEDEMFWGTVCRPLRGMI
jgi:hypothetical protein